MDTYLGVNDEVIKTALSVSMEPLTNPEGPPFVVKKIDDSPSHVIVAFPGSRSPDYRFAGDGEAKSFGEIKIDDKKFPSLRSLGNDVFAKVNEAFMERFLEILEDGNGRFCKEVTTAVENGKQLLFAGHSSGGPTAIYATVWFLEKYIRSKQNQTSRPLCLTFGSPLTTDRTFCHAIRREDWSDCFVHFVTQLDIVPRILLAPCSSTMPLLQEIPPLCNTHHKAGEADKAKLASSYVTVMKNASCVANHAACELTGSKHTLFDTMSKFIKISPYRPCGKYVFCTETGRLVVVENPDAVLQLLFYSLRIKSNTELPNRAEESTKLQNRAEESLKAHWAYKDALDKSLAVHDIVRLENLRELPLSSDDAMGIGAALNDLNLCVPARLCLRAAGQLEEKKRVNQKRINDKQAEIKKALDALQKYRTASKEDDVGYYDAFKLQKKEEDFKANVKRLELAAIWDEIIEMLRKEELPDRFEAEKEWVDLGTRFRQLVEPLDIANYYRHSRNDESGPYMGKGRPNRYKLTQRWREHANQLQSGDTYCESSFWAKVEDIKSKKWEEIKEEALKLDEDLKNWQSNGEVEGDVFLKNSTLFKWGQTISENLEGDSFIKGLVQGQNSASCRKVV